MSANLYFCVFSFRLRQESELLSRQTSSHHWSQNDLSSLASTSVAASPTSLLSCGRDLSDQEQQHQQQIQQHNNSSESTSSTETLKWLGSMSDVSEVSHGTGFSAISESGECLIEYFPKLLGFAIKIYYLFSFYIPINCAQFSCLDSKTSPK